MNSNFLELAMKYVTLRKLVVFICVLVTVKVAWNLLRGTDKDFSDLEHRPDFGLSDKDCIFINGKCVKSPEGLHSAITGKGLHTYKDSFYLDGRPFQILGGSFHYFRTQPEQWRDRLLKMRAAGLNTVTTYIPWNVHEKIRLQYNFQGRYKLARFIAMVHEVGLHMIIRAGPYICAEWDLGGLPSWLLHDPAIKFRSSSSKAFITYVEQYFSKLLPILAPFTHKKGGPIIAFQIENEFGAWHNRDESYMGFLLDQHRNYNLDELFLTSDGSRDLTYGSIPGVLATVNFANSPKTHLNVLRDFQPNKPLMVTEFWSGWFDHWTEKHHRFSPKETANKLYTILIDYNASVNFYMFTGGTNFGFYNGANNQSGGYESTVTSYDYDAAISECGDVTEKYQAIRGVIKKLNLVEADWSIEVPANQTKASYGFVEMKEIFDFEDLITISEKFYDKILHDQPKFMEYLDINEAGGQGYGWILYSTKFSKGNQLKIDGIIYDRAQIFVNKKQVSIYSWDNPKNTIDIDDRLLLNGINNNTLEILVENCGRVNFRRFSDERLLLENQRKGMQGRVLIDQSVLSKWRHVPLDFDHEFRTTLSASNKWKSLNQTMSKSATNNRPVLMRGFFNIPDQPLDTFIDMNGWEKGIVLINGFNLGRYWKVGPQRTLYIPAPLLKMGENEVIIFELHTALQNVKLTDKPQLG